MTTFDAAVEAAQASLSAPEDAARFVRPGMAFAGAVVIVALTGAYLAPSIFFDPVFEVGLRLDQAEWPALNAFCAHP